MGLLKPRKNKKFGYSPRYYNDKGEGNPFHIKHIFDEFRNSVGETKGLKAKFTSAWEDLRHSSNKNTNRRILLIITVLVLIFLFIIEFDLSIFFFNK